MYKEFYEQEMAANYELCREIGQLKHLVRSFIEMSEDQIDVNSLDTVQTIRHNVLMEMAREKIAEMEAKEAKILAME